MSSRTSDPIAVFFNRFPAFTPNPSHSSNENFRRLCRFMSWNRKKRDQERKLFRVAVVQTFNDTFGNDVNDLQAWGRLCEFIGAEEIPEDLAGRKKLIRKTHVNLVDLVDAHRSGAGNGTVKKFRNVWELRKYTLNSGKVFPKEEAHAGGILKKLLRQILHVPNRGRAGAQK